MSTVPPGPVPPGNPLPWEDRENRGLVSSFFDTLGLLVSRPAEAWARMRESGDTISPLLFGVVVCWLSMAVQGILFRLVGMPLLPRFLERRFGPMGGFGGATLAVGLIGGPFLVGLGLFLGAARRHPCCMPVSPLLDARSRFQRTPPAPCHAAASGRDPSVRAGGAGHRAPSPNDFGEGRGRRPHPGRGVLRRPGADRFGRRRGVVESLWASLTAASL